MPLPFSRLHNGLRQFACFVCGILLKDRKSFNDHVKEKHTIGKEYVLCPLPHCQSVARDLRSHFRVQHQQTPIPKNCQLRCEIWSDPKDPARKKKKVLFEEGYFPSAKNRTQLHYDSGWERTVFDILEKMPDVLRYEKEPLSIEYYFDNEIKHYLPDLRVFFRDGRIAIYEIKPSSQTNLPINEAKWLACGDYCRKRG